MNKEMFLDKLDKAIDNHHGITVAIEAPNLPDHELITNSATNAPVKREYYAGAYDDDMRLKVNPNICIVGISIGLD